MAEGDVIITYTADTTKLSEQVDELIEKLERIKVLFIELGIKVYINHEVSVEQNFGCCPETK